MQEDELMKHTLRMLFGCLLPLLLIFLLPLFGLSEGVTLFIALILIFACHLLMIGGDHRSHHHENPQVDQGENHAHP
jgi:hypothetical protein